MDELVKQLVDLYQFDLNVFTNKWMYIPLLIPIMFYCAFFLLKWSFLTAPIWIPFVIIASSIISSNKGKNNDSEYL